MVVLRCAGGLAFGLLLANCAGEFDTGKYALPQREASAASVRFSRTDINPDGTLVNPYPTGVPRGSGKKYASKEMNRVQSDVTPTVQQEGPSATSNIGRHAINIRASSQQSDEPTTAGTLSGSKPQFLMPVIGSDRWKQEETENEKLDKQLDALLRGSICAKC